MRRMSNDGTIMTTTLAHPDLYRESGDHVVLLAARCAACRRIAFPRQRYGCEKCGSRAMTDVELPAAGTLASFATVHLHQSKSIAAPFVVGEVKIDDGPTLRLTLVEPTDEGLRIGVRMEGILFRSTSGPDPNVEHLELRFTREVV